MNCWRRTSELTSSPVKGDDVNSLYSVAMLRERRTGGTTRAPSHSFGEIDDEKNDENGDK